jgi:Ni,Fe-hydrogenase III large subunit
MNPPTFVRRQVVSKPSFKIAMQGNHDGERLTRLEQGVKEMVRSIWMLIELVRSMQVNDPTPEIQKTIHL